jgi:radical SAM protein with 4Fe4S-binding SPASM domain
MIVEWRNRTRKEKGITMKERKPQFLSDGIKHATINGHRFHLRLKDPIKENFLWVDGTQPPLILDKVAADFVSLLIDAMWLFQQGEGDESPKVINYVVEKMHEKYGRQRLGLKKVTKRRITADLHRIWGTIMSVAEGNCPVDIGLNMKEIDPSKWIAPARMDLAVTYRCNLACEKCYTGGSQEMKELPAGNWVRIFKILWELGVPQVVFTGGEPTLREDLVELVGEAEEFVTGLITNGVKLAELAEPLRDASLDYIQVTLESHIPEIHNKMVGNGDAFEKTVAGIRKALELGMQVVTNTTLTKENAGTFVDLLRFGKQLGLRYMSCNHIICSGKGVTYRIENGLSTPVLKETLAKATAVADELGINFGWYTPTCYLEIDPTELGLGIKSCSAAQHNMTIQPDGTVLPCQSWPETVGNILADPWEKIWNHPTSKKLREHGFLKEQQECSDCEHAGICGGGCPLEYLVKLKKGGAK